MICKMEKIFTYKKMGKDDECVKLEKIVRFLKLVREIKFLIIRKRYEDPSYKLICLDIQSN